MKSSFINTTAESRCSIPDRVEMPRSLQVFMK